MPGRAHEIDAHTVALPLNKISKEILNYASLSREQMKEVLHGAQ